MKVYVDTSVLIAFLNPADTFHNSALKILLNKNNEFVTSVITLDEALWVLTKAFGKTNAVKLMDVTLSFPFLDFLSLNKSLMQNVVHSFESYSVDTRDVIHFVTSQENDCLAIATFDSDFKKFKTTLITK